MSLSFSCQFNAKRLRLWRVSTKRPALKNRLETRTEVVNSKQSIKPLLTKRISISQKWNQKTNGSNHSSLQKKSISLKPSSRIFTLTFALFSSPGETSLANSRENKISLAPTILTSTTSRPSNHPFRRAREAADTSPHENPRFKIPQDSHNLNDLCLRLWGWEPNLSTRTYDLIYNNFYTGDQSWLRSNKFVRKPKIVR